MVTSGACHSAIDNNGNPETITTSYNGRSADIVNNTIQNNPLAGIAVQYSSSARIGWTGPPNNRISKPNTIQYKGPKGIQIYGGSSAQVFSNTIQNNGSHGVFLDYRKFGSREFPRRVHQQRSAVTGPRCAAGVP